MGSNHYVKKCILCIRNLFLFFVRTSAALRHPIHMNMEKHKHICLVRGLQSNTYTVAADTEV